MPEGARPEKAQMWTSRDVQFAVFPSTTNETFERFFDALAEHYWETWRHQVFRTLSISSHELRVTVGGWPLWVPAWAARRSVASFAAECGVGGDATFVIERAVLPSPAIATGSTGTPHA